MTDYLFHISIVEQVLLGCLVVAFAFQLYFYLRYMAAPLRYMRKKRKEPAHTDATMPAVSIIIAAKNEEDNLRIYLPHILNQDYPEFEVIVVDDGSEDDTHTLLDDMARLYPNLRHTFVPRQAQVRSTKKLAITLGAKAAKYDILVLTDADCVVESRLWLRNMAAEFVEGKDLVLGYGAYFKQDNFVNRFIQYDTLFNGLQYLGMALSGHPYMGVGRNLAYRKQLFFQNGGFAGLLSTRSGDDDLFVSKVATRHNVAVALSKDSITYSPTKRTFGDWLRQKERHLSVSNLYSRANKFRLTVEPMSRAIFYAAVIALCAIDFLYLGVFALGLLVVRWVMQAIILRISAKRLEQPLSVVSIMFFDIFMPLNSLMLMAHYRLIGHRKMQW